MHRTGPAGRAQAPPGCRHAQPALCAALFHTALLPVSAAQRVRSQLPAPAKPQGSAQDYDTMLKELEAARRSAAAAEAQAAAARKTAASKKRMVASVQRAAELNAKYMWLDLEMRSPAPDGSKLNVPTVLGKPGAAGLLGSHMSAVMPESLCAGRWHVCLLAARRCECTDRCGLGHGSAVGK